METKRVTQVSKLDMKACLSALLFEDYHVLIVPDKIVKQNRSTNKNVSEIIIKEAYKLCYIGFKSTVIGVLQLPAGKITLVETKETLTALYTLDLPGQQSVTEVCYLDTYRNTGADLPDPMYVFCIAGAKLGANDILSIVTPAKQRQSGSRRPCYPATINPFKGQQLRGITGLSALAWNTIVVSCSEGVKCIKYEKGTLETTILWAYDSHKYVTDVCCIKVKDDKQVLASIQDEKRVVLFDPNGKIIKQNVLPDGSELKPDKISARDGQMLVKEFNESTWSTYATEVA